MKRAAGHAPNGREGVAARAGVGKQTIYRRWSSKAAVVLDGFTARAETEIAAPDTGSVREDVRLLLSRAFAALRSGRGHVVTVLMAEAQLNQEFASVFRDAFISRRRQVLINLLARGIARGQLRRGTDLELLADLLYGPMWYRLLNRHAVLDDAFAQTLTDAVLGKPE